jgi:hypothetical protein
LLPGIDQRSAWVRRAKDLIELHLGDLGEDATAVERSLVRRIAIVTTQLEMLEAEFAVANGQASERRLDLYFRGAGQLRRLLEALGIKRDVKTKTINSSPLMDAIRADLDAQRNVESKCST